MKEARSHRGAYGTIPVLNDRQDRTKMFGEYTPGCKTEESQGSNDSASLKLSGGDMGICTGRSH